MKQKEKLENQLQFIQERTIKYKELEHIKNRSELT